MINPGSNWGKGSEAWRKLAKKHGFTRANQVDLTDVEVARVAINHLNPDIVVVGGGDGSINMAAQAVLSAEYQPTIAVLPLGFGNAISYNLGVETHSKAIDVIKKQYETIEIDYLETNIKNAPIGLFSISVGFDAKVIHDRKNSPLSLNRYLLPTISNLIGHPKTDISITIDESTVIRARAASAMISNSPVIGKNFVVAEESRLNDGFLVVNIFPTKYSYVTNMRFKGQQHPLYLNHGKVSIKARHVKIEGENYVQVDGDASDHKKPLIVSVASKKLKFLKNKDENIKQQYKSFLKPIK
jgi:diacylglycerol kinase family enzyme